jgi:acetyltransferase-like isoleucine patch superfamily enzyme
VVTAILQVLKRLLITLCLALSSPWALFCWLEKGFSQDSEFIFSFFAHGFALLPGIPGSFLRRAFYSLTLANCSTNCHIGFGSFFSHRNATVEDHVSIGNYSILGTVHIGPRCEIASRVSITSGKNQHAKDKNGHWTPFDLSMATQVTIGCDVWIGEGAIVMADIGWGSLIGAGSVVVDKIPENAVAVGNPAKVLNSVKIVGDAKRDR